MFQKKINLVKHYLILLTLGLCLSACAKLENSGNQIDPARVEQISRGDHKNKVLRLMGSPTFITNIKSEKYIYIQEKLRHHPIIAPTLYDLDTVTFTLDGNDKVKDVEINLDMQPNLKLNKFEKRTVIKGNEINPIRQIISNIGRYNSAKKPANEL